MSYNDERNVRITIIQHTLSLSHDHPIPKLTNISQPNEDPPDDVINIDGSQGELGDLRDHGDLGDLEELGKPENLGDLGDLEDPKKDLMEKVEMEVSSWP